MILHISVQPVLISIRIKTIVIIAIKYIQKVMMLMVRFGLIVTIVIIGYFF